MNKHVYVALLRGINVGGKAKVAMSRLKELGEELGFEQVRTYINSGNVILVSSKQASDVCQQLEQGIQQTFGLSVPVVVRSFAQIKTLLSEVPNAWSNDTEQKTDVLFLWPDIDKPSIVEHVDTKPELERVLYVPGALVWNIARKDVTRGSGIKLIKSDMYQHMTVRNINTVRKLYALMQEVNT